MADFLNKLKKSLDKGAAVVSAKSNTLIETQKLRSEISAANKQKKETILALGQKVYEEGKAGSFDIADAETLITAISDLESKVKDLEAKIVKIQEEEKEKMEALNQGDAPVDVAFEEVAEEEAEALEETEATEEDKLEVASEDGDSMDAEDEGQETQY